MVHRLLARKPLTLVGGGITGFDLQAHSILLWYVVCSLVAD
ncbi:hypothetical protein CCP3SC1AL1_1050008 [Gammaproteobacteria bacterium]